MTVKWFFISVQVNKKRRTQISSEVARLLLISRFWAKKKKKKKHFMVFFRLLNISNEQVCLFLLKLSIYSHSNSYLHARLGKLYHSIMQLSILFLEIILFCFAKKATNYRLVIGCRKIPIFFFFLKFVWRSFLNY